MVDKVLLIENSIRLAKARLHIQEELTDFGVVVLPLQDYLQVLQSEFVSLVFEYERLVQRDSNEDNNGTF
jgi:hypothetical protein